METKVQIEGHTNLVRSIDSHAIINTSTNDYNAFINKRKKEKDTNEKIQKLENEVVEIKAILSEILNFVKR